MTQLNTEARAVVEVLEPLLQRAGLAFTFANGAWTLVKKENNAFNQGKDPRLVLAQAIFALIPSNENKPHHEEDFEKWWTKFEAQWTDDLSEGKHWAQVGWRARVTGKL